MSEKKKKKKVIVARLIRKRIGRGKNVWTDHARRIPWIMELSVTQLFFELQTEDVVYNF